MPFDKFILDVYLFSESAENGLRLKPPQVYQANGLNLRDYMKWFQIRHHCLFQVLIWARYWLLSDFLKPLKQSGLRNAIRGSNSRASWTIGYRVDLKHRARKFDVFHMLCLSIRRYLYWHPNLPRPQLNRQTKATRQYVNAMTKIWRFKYLRTGSLRDESNDAFDYSRKLF